MAGVKEPQPSQGWSVTKTLVVGGLELLALVMVGLLIFLIYHGTQASESEPSNPSHSNATEASETSNHTMLSSPSTSLATASKVHLASSSGLASTATLLTTEVAEAVTTDLVAATAIFTGMPMLDTSRGGSLVSQDAPPRSPSPGFAPSETEKAGAVTQPTRPATFNATDTREVPGTTKMTTTATWFGASQHLSACHNNFDDSDLVAAVSPALFGSEASEVSELCGAKIRIWQPESRKTISATIMDVCNQCPTTTSVDLTHAAFLKLAPGGKKDPDAALEPGVLPIQWWFVDAAYQAKVPVGCEPWIASQ
ncbi:hypothetical protein JCM3774_002472 [Rhodotorula dairenensis]